MKPLVHKLIVILSSPANQFYCCTCRSLVGKSEIQQHRELRHFVDEKPQSHYLEVEQSAGLLS